MFQSLASVILAISANLKTYLYSALLLVGLFAGYKGWRYYQTYVKSQITVLQQNILDRDKKIVAITEEYNKLEKARADVVAENTQLKNDNDALIKKALNELERKCSYLKILGSYPIGE